VKNKRKVVVVVVLGGVGFQPVSQMCSAVRWELREGSM
jgi:hypothetical protein